MKNIILGIIFSVTLGFLLVSCCKKDAYPDISSDELSWFPYHQGDTIVFKKTTTGDTLKFYGESAETNEGHSSGPCPKEFNKTISIIIRKFDPVDIIVGTFQMSSKEPLIKSVNSAVIGNGATYIATMNLNGVDYKDIYCCPSQRLTDIYSKYYVCKGIGIIRLDISNSSDYFYLIQ